ncbi:MAG: hypothetical protein S4CHLAM123_09550 [Chlamydiales bacterium]|nr:hypothetical protein [Chlamydiales bacterium]
MGAQFGQKHGVRSSLISIIIGNLILWIVGLATIAMTVDGRKNAIENLQKYIGKIGCIVGSVILSFAFLFWFSIQLSDTVSELTLVLEPYARFSQISTLQIGIGLGACIALLSIGGMRLIKWFNVIALPFLFIFILYALFLNEHHPKFSGSWKVSIPVVIASLLLALPGTVNLPTFFRHRRKPADAYFALSLFIIFTTLIECLAIFLVDQENGAFFLQYLNSSRFNLICVIFFLVLSVFSANLVNIYFASAAWEEIFPWTSRSKELTIIGIAGTVVFTFVRWPEVLTYAERLVSIFIANLGIVVVIGYLIQEIVVHRLRKYELALSFLCWVIGCSVTVSVQNLNTQNSAQAFTAGVGASILAFLIVLFFEETVWCIRVRILKNLK